MKSFARVRSEHDNQPGDKNNYLNQSQLVVKQLQRILNGNAFYYKVSKAFIRAQVAHGAGA